MNNTQPTPSLSFKKRDISANSLSGSTRINLKRIKQTKISSVIPVNDKLSNYSFSDMSSVAIILQDTAE